MAIPFSEKLAQAAPHLTIDYLLEFTASYEKLTTAYKCNAVQVVTPWVKNLVHCNPPGDHEATVMKLRECIRALIDLTVKETEISTMIQKHIWVEVGKLDAICVGIVLDELVRCAVDGGIGSQRCEAMADTLVSLSSIVIRGKVITRLRKVFRSVSTAVAHILAGCWTSRRDSNPQSHGPHVLGRNIDSHSPIACLGVQYAPASSNYDYRARNSAHDHSPSWHWASRNEDSRTWHDIKSHPLYAGAV